jgi:hypothetical protein
MTAMPPQPARKCVAYTPDDTGQFFIHGVEEWLTGPRRPTPQGRVDIPGRRGVLYHVGALREASQQHREWPPEVHEWLRMRGNMPDALVVVWE